MRLAAEEKRRHHRPDGGIVLKHKIGDKVNQGDVLCELYANKPIDKDIIASRSGIQFCGYGRQTAENIERLSADNDIR